MDVSIIIIATADSRKTSSGNSSGKSSALQVSMYSEKKGCTDMRMSALLLDFRLRLCVFVRKWCAVLGDRWVVLDTD